MVIMMKRKQNQEKMQEEKDNVSIIVASTPLNRNLRNVRAQQVVPIHLSPVLSSRALAKNRLNKSKSKEESESTAKVASKTVVATVEKKIAEKPALQSVKNPVVNMNKPLEMVIDDSEEDEPVVSPKRNVKVTKTKPVAAKASSKKPVQKNNVVSPSTKPVPPSTKSVPPSTKPVAPSTKPVPPSTKPVPLSTKPVPPSTKPIPPSNNPVSSPSKPEPEKLPQSLTQKRSWFEFTIPNKRPRIFIPEDFEDFDFFSDGDPPESEKNSKFELPKARLNFDAKPEQEVSEVFAQPGQSTQNCYPNVNDFLVIDEENLPGSIQTGVKEKPTKTSNKSASPKNLKKGIAAKQPSAKENKAKKSEELNAAPESENDGSCNSEALQEEENVPVHVESVAVNGSKPQKAAKKTISPAPKVVSQPPTNTENVGRRTRSPRKPAAQVQSQTKRVKKTLMSDDSEAEESEQSQTEQSVTSEKMDITDASETEVQAEPPLPKTKSKVLRQSNTTSQKKIVGNNKINTPTVEDTRTKPKVQRAAQSVRNQKSPKESEEELGVRRSQRARVKPVSYWAGERLQTKEDSKGEIEVVHLGPCFQEAKKPDTKGRPRKDVYTVGALLRKLASPNDPLEEDEDVLSDSELPTLIHMKLPFNPAQPKKLTEIEVASEVRHLEAISKMEGTTKEDTNVRYSTTLDGSFISCGYIRINAGSSKGLQVPQNMTVFTLLTPSKLEVTINGEKMNIGFGQHFWIPPGIAYDIKNLGTSSSLLQFSTVDIGEAYNVFGHKK